MMPSSVLQQASNLLLIDGDAIPWMIGWHQREHDDETRGRAELDKWMEEFLLLTGANGYLGILAPKKEGYFRSVHYHVQKYKGNRSPRPDWIKQWGPVLEDQLLDKWGFLRSPDMWETDDMIALLATELHRYGTSGGTVHICSPDKDLKQIPGYHLNYQKVDESGAYQQEEVDERKSRKNYFLQLLTGDSTDNILGIPGIGPKKAEAILGDEPYLWNTQVRLAYHKHFGEYYGEVILEETRIAIELMTRRHPLWNPEIKYVIEPYLAGIKVVEHGQVSGHTERA